MPDCCEPISRQILDRIDREELDDLAYRYHSHPFEKYFDVDYWIRMNVRRALDLGLHRSGPKRILDLGAGFGYFVAVCNELGHNAIGIDLADPLYSSVAALLGARLVVHEIKPFDPLPDLGPFDVMTANMITFNGHVSWTQRTDPPAVSPNLWGAREWAYLLDDVDASLVYLEMNGEMDGTYYPPGLREFFLGRGAHIDAHRVTIGRLS